MYLDYTKIGNGAKKPPMLRLRTLAGKELGVIPYVHNLRFEINYSDISTIEFSVPYMVNGLINPLYGAITSYKLVYTDSHGIYVLVSPNKEGDGVAEHKRVRGYSLEQLFQMKNLFLGEGTYNFWNPADREDTILERIVELDPTWHVGYVAPRLIGCYRTFDEYNSDALTFCYNDATEKYRCTFVFDVYEKSISVYDADEDAEVLPIYLSYKNLVDTVGVNEITEEFITKLHLYGSDSLSIRDVNPTGTDYIVNLDYFLGNGDLGIKIGNSKLTLAERVQNWQVDIAANQQYYTGLVAAKASLTAQVLSEQAALVELQGELDSLLAQQNVTVQAIAMESSGKGKQTQQDNLNNINAQIAEKRGEIAEKQDAINVLEVEIESYKVRIKSVTEKLTYSSYFTEEEQRALNPYLIEGTFTDETFVATDVDISASSTTAAITGAVSVDRAVITQIELPDFEKTMYVVDGGTLLIPKSGLSAEIVCATLDVKSDNSYVLTGHLGSVCYNDRDFPSGLITLSGSLSQFFSDVAFQMKGDIREHVGSKFSFLASESEFYFTANVSEYQKYSVAMELYGFGMRALDDCAWPIYEFTIDSANFLYQKNFEPFKNKLELGKAVYLELGSEGRITAKIIGIELDYENINNFNLVFSNRYQRKRKTFRWIEEISKTNRAARSFNAGKYIYNRTAAHTTQVNEFMNGLQKGTVSAILSSKNQSVTFDGGGIHVGGDSKYQMRLTDRMFAMTDDDWATAKVGIGLFACEEINGGSPVWGINTDLIAGPLHIGKTLIIENEQVDENNKPTGVMQFKVDSTGAWLNNSTFVLQKDGGGKILLNPKFGIVAGTKDLFDTDGTTVRPSFVDRDGMIVLDKDGMPVNSNFFLDLRDGSAYFRGNVYAEDGVFNGTVYAKDGKFTGEVEATSGTFTGKIKAATLEGKLKGGTNGLIEGIGINIGNGAFTVDTGGNAVMSGNLTLSGNINLSNGKIVWGGNGPVKYQFSVYASGPWHSTMQDNDKYRRDSLDGGTTWGTPYQFRGTDGANGSDANVTFDNIKAALQKASLTQTSFITADEIGAPTIYGAKIYGAEIYAGGINEKGGQVIGLTDGGIEIFDGSGRSKDQSLVLRIKATEIPGASYSNAVIQTGYNPLMLSATYLTLDGTNEITFKGKCADFTGVHEIKGVHATFA